MTGQAVLIALSGYGRTGFPGFDNGRYLEVLTEVIEQRMNRFDGTLCLECGGKLLYDYHAARI